MFRKLLLIALLSLVGIVFLVGLRRAMFFGLFEEDRPDHPLSCRPVLGVWSSEDIAIDPVTSIAYISGDHRPRRALEKRQPGMIYRYDLRHPENEVEEALPADLPFEFHPQGIGLFPDADPRLLFVVNRRQDGNYVDIFEIEGNGLNHRESIFGGEMLHFANDVAPVGQREFYVTNDHSLAGSWGKRAEEFLGLHLSTVVYFEGNIFRVVADDISCANGIAMSRDGTEVYVAATLSKSIRIYQRDEGTGDLSFQRTIRVDSAVEQIDVDPSGTLWVAAHPNLIAFFRYLRDREALSPSEVYRISLSPEKDQVELVYRSNGEYLSAASVGVHWGEQLLIGSVMDHRFLVCEAPPEAPQRGELPQ